MRKILLPPWEEYKRGAGFLGMTECPTADERFMHTEFWEPQVVADEIERIKREIDTTGHSFNPWLICPGGSRRGWEL